MALWYRVASFYLRLHRQHLERFSSKACRKERSNWRETNVLMWEITYCRDVFGSAPRNKLAAHGFSLD